MDYLEKVKEREKELAGLRLRQDGDKGLLYLAKYAMTDTDLKKIPDIVNVTLNRPAIFAANVISALGKTGEQVIVEAGNKELDTNYIERFQRAAFASANARLRKQGKWQINPFFDEQTCIRGAGAARCLFRMEGDILVADITPWDWRYLTWEDGIDGLDYGGFHSVVTQDMIDAEQWSKGLGIKISGRTAKKLDIWDREHNEIWLDERKVFEQGHPYGFTPVALAIVPLGSMLADEDSTEHQGESIFFLIRTVIPELNRLVSIMQTLNLKAIKPPIKQKKAGGGEATPYDQVMGSGAATAMDVNEDIQPIDYGDAKQAAQIAYGMFDKAMQEGSLSSVDLGTMNFQLAAVALIEIGEGRDQVFLPRLKTKALLNQELAEMFTAQCLQIGGALEIGTVGHKEKFDMSKIEGAYETTFKYTAKSPRTDMARYSMAATAKSLGIPQRAIDEEILQVEDIDGRERQRRWEEAERIFPSIKIHRTLRSLLGDTPQAGDDDADYEAYLASLEADVNLEAMLRGEVGQSPQVEETPKPHTLPMPKGTELAGSPRNIGGEG